MSAGKEVELHRVGTMSRRLDFTLRHSRNFNKVAYVNVRVEMYDRKA